MSKTVSTIKAFLLILILGAVLAPLATAGEIYGRVAKNGKVFANASVTIQCDSFRYTQSTSTSNSGAYRLPGPSGEQQCDISVNGTSNTVPVITSQGRTRANLEVKRNRLYRR